MPPLRSLIAPPPTTAVACRVVFNGTGAGIEAHGTGPTLRVALPVFAGTDTDILLDDATEAERRNGCVRFETSRRIAGFAIAAEGMELEAAARELYRSIFAATAGRRLYRLWNYVPQINAVEQGLENYRRFCRGRSHAFEENFGHGFERQLPAASAVGAVRGPLAVAFLAGDDAARHVENPHQVPAFEYPREYGPRPPSFARATVVATAARQELFISGTAAIRGHATVAAHDLAGQLACTCENLRIIAATAGAGPNFGADAGWQRSVKIYVRHAADVKRVQQHLERDLLRPGDAVGYLHADLCRADLLLEVEAILTKTA